MDPRAQNSRWQEQELTYGSMSFSKMHVMYEKYAGSLTRYSVTFTLCFFVSRCEVPSAYIRETAGQYSSC
jgi:hypothetical protein